MIEYQILALINSILTVFIIYLSCKLYIINKCREEERIISMLDKYLLKTEINKLKSEIEKLREVKNDN
ncbi:hypothetical protein ACKA04_02445 [Helcococcus kunzii]|uniref:hypothetical protein n=1 Tax=Helcococcus kunzii TaxID=40091 RepID=UPI0038A0B37A